MRIGKKKRKDAKGRALRIFFATDVHGSERCFRKFLAGAKAYDADVLILGGDVAGKGLVPIVRQNGSLVAEVRGEPVAVPADEEQRLRQEINLIGCYPRQMQPDEIARLQDDPAGLDALFREEIVAQLAAWCELAAERLPDDVRCIITPGNDDPLEVDAVLAAAEKVECPERELCELGPALLASLGDVTPTPWHTDREFEEPEMAQRMAEMLDRVPADRNVILNFHNPPYGTGLDTATELDDSLKPVLRGGQPSFVPVGSKAVLEAIRKYQPTVALHGHIHESPGAQKIGPSLCINPGSDYGADVLKGVVVDLDGEGNCLDYLLTTG